MAKRIDADATPPDNRSEFERFEELARRIVNVPREEVPPLKHTPRVKSTTPRDRAIPGD
jgi:hypothetical protein